ncbi:peroxiredoxin family protein [Marinicella meishanensis]|uniref:peroxiredoxin family protein n=1 Tax=Marinicella meishanensis TaxID=2873263 RepID=UPI001CBB48EC|nr:TlpA disulfide reductase family protein [Marinicella sp. NBU2979]
MIKKFKKWPKNKYLSGLLQSLLLLALVALVLWWTQRGTLSADGQQAPDFVLPMLNGPTVTLSDYQGQEVLLYFFAPWCSICRLSADNLNDLRAARDESELAILMVALSYQNRQEVVDFVADLELQVPVLFGHEQQMADYQIQGFPTYYVIDSDGRLQAKSLGYSTEWGMRFRTWVF